MSRVLVVSDNDILNQLYTANIEVYLGAKVNIARTKRSALEYLGRNKYELILAATMIDGNEIATEIYEYVESKRLTTKMFVLGKPKKELENVLIIHNTYNLQTLIKSCARVMGVTAKKMAEIEVATYFPVSNDFLLRLKEVPCAIYLQMKTGDYTLIARKGDAIGEMVKELVDQGVNRLFVHSNNRLVIVNAISDSLVEILKNTEGLEVNEKNERVKTSFNFIASTFAESKEVSEEIIALTNKCTAVIEEIVNETPSLAKLLAILNSQKDSYVYTHSIMAAYVSNHIIRRVSWGGESHIEKINFVLFFHDIVLAPIYQKYPHLKYEEDLLFNGELSDKDKETVLNHARLAAEIIVTYKRAPIGADLLIKQHHGITNGIGFAIDFKDDISPLTKVVLIAESFVEEFLRMRDQDSKYHLDVQEIIKVLSEKYKRPTYKKIIETLEDFKVN